MDQCFSFFCLSYMKMGIWLHSMGMTHTCINNKQVRPLSFTVFIHFHCRGRVSQMLVGLRHIFQRIGKKFLYSRKSENCFYIHVKTCGWGQWYTAIMFRCHAKIIWYPPTIQGTNKHTGIERQSELAVASDWFTKGHWRMMRSIQLLFF